MSEQALMHERGGQNLTYLLYMYMNWPRDYRQGIKTVISFSHFSPEQ